MNSREKFLSVVNHDKEQEVPDWEFGYWFDTIQNWYTEGLPREKPPDMMEYIQWVFGNFNVGLDVFDDKKNYYSIDVNNYFKFDERVHYAPVYAAPLPKYERIVFEEDKDTIVFLREDDGKIVKTRKDGSSMPQFLQYPVKNRKEINNIIEKFDPDDKDRLPKNLDKLLEDYKKRTYPLGIGVSR